MTVIVLTSGTSWSVPADFSNTNQVETWAAGGGGGGGSAASLGANAGGSGAYSTSSNLTGLSGSISIGIGVGGTGTLGVVGNNGGDTWFNGSSLATGTVSAAGGKGGTTGSTGGAGGSSSLGNGTTKRSGSTGGGNGASQTSGAGGAGAPGAGAAGGAGQGSQAGGIGGHGGTGDGGTGGGAGAGGATSGSPAGGDGGSNVEGGGGGGGGFGGNTAGAVGGAGGLPGGGAGGNGDGEGTTFKAGGGGQIRITYTPAAANITPEWFDLPPSRYRDKWKGLDEQYDMQGWQQSPRSADSLPEIREQPLEVPPGKWNWSRYQDWQRSPTVPELDIIGRAWVFLPQGNWKWLRHSYDGWQRGVIPAEYLVPLPQTEVPKGRYNSARYQDVQEGPQPASISPPPIQPFTDLPQRSWDRRMQYQGVQLAPQPTIMSPPLPVYDVPPGRWNAGRYQDWQQWNLRREFDVPAPVVDVPRGVSRYDYTEWQTFQIPPSVLGPIQSSASYDLPPVGRLQQLAKYSDLFQGIAVGPTPPDVIPVIPRTFLPLVGVGSFGP